MAHFSGNPDDYTMSFGDHLDELRRRILLALIVPIPISIVTFLFSNELINLLLRPLYWVLGELGLPQRVQALSPPEVLLAKIKISIIAAIIVSLPWILYQAWRFIRPGLYAHERRFVYFLIPGSAILTAAGVLLMYYLMLPLMLYVLIGIGAGMPQPVAGPAMDPRVRAVLESVEEFPVRRVPPANPQPGDVWLLWPEMTIHAAVKPLADEDDAQDENDQQQQDESAGGEPAGNDGNAHVDGDNAAQAEPSSPPGATGQPVVEVLMVPQPQRAGIEQSFRMAEYISFVLLLYLAIVLAFQMPLVIVLLGWLGLASEQWLRSKRKYAVIVIAVISAMITPADVISMLAMLIPLYGLYELGILLLRIAPASAVAEGRFAYGRQSSSNKRAGKSDEPSSEPTGPRRDEKSIPRSDETDGETTGADDGPRPPES